MPTIKFEDNPAIKDRMSAFETVQVDAAAVVKSWRMSLFSFEWLEPSGKIKAPAALKDTERAKREKVEQTLRDNIPLPRPVLGIGVADNIEIGAGRDIFLTLHANGHDTISVHVPTSCLKLFQPFLSE